MPKNYKYMTDGFLPYDITDKTKVITDYVRYMLARTQQIFKYTGLPDTLPKRELELMIQSNGHTAIYEYEGKIYAFTGSLGGEPNEYLMPTLYTIANPYLKLSKSFKIDEECVVIPNDSMYIGMLPMYTKYATALTENDISIYLADINSRILSIISAQDDSTKKSAEKFIDDIVKGKLSIVADRTFIDGLGLKTSSYTSSGNSNKITDLIELEQYLKASWYNDLGLNANYNMKREAINSGESQLNNDMLFPLIDDMLEIRKKAIEKVNKMFNLNISVSLSSSWEDNQEEVDKEHKQLGGVKDENQGANTSMDDTGAI